MALRPVEGDWPAIACVLVWRLEPPRVELTRRDLSRLPDDRVLWIVGTERGHHLELAWLSPKAAETASRLQAIHASTSDDRVGLGELQGRWQKIACVLLWKLYRGKKTVVTSRDVTELPADQTLLTEPFKDTVLLRYIPRTEAERIRQWERDNVGRRISENLK